MNDSHSEQIDPPQLTLDFELGQLPIPVGTLRQLGPGYIFTMPSTVNSPVTVRWGGTEVGRGDLALDDEGALVVRITELKSWN